MKKLILTVAACLAIASASAAELNWLTSLPDAQAKAKADKKLVFVEFTGSDWCPPCKALHKEVLDSEEFAKEAESKYVLVELDYPRKKQQSAELIKANQELSEKYKIEGFPTVLILDANGKELYRQVGYGGDSAKAYLAKLDKAVGK